MDDQNIISPSSPEERESSPLDHSLRPSEKEYRLGIRVEEKETMPSEKKEEIESKWEEAGVKVEKETSEKEKVSTTSFSTQKPSLQPKSKPPKTIMQRQIEKILSEDIVAIYNSMDAQHQKAFRAEGEKVSSRIEMLLKEAKVRVKEILNLIKKWLSKIPGVNKFFLIQEAKIKTDKILALRKK